MDLGGRAADLYDANDNEGLFQLARDSWPEAPDASFPEGVGVGEVCRYAFIRYRDVNMIDQHLWRARALSAAVLDGARDTGAGLLLTAFFAAIEETVNGEREGHEHGYEQARDILREMRRLVPDGAPRCKLYERLYHEKRAYAFVMEATHGGQPRRASGPLLVQAVADYQRAEQLAVGNERALLKVRGGLALARYLLGAADEDQIPCLEQTTQVLHLASAAGYADVERWASINVDAMSRGDFIGWTAYEVL
jgi:hypothetical protein